MTATMAIWYSDNGSTEEQHTRTFHRPNYVMADVDYDWTDFVKCDYPAYYRVLDQRDLLNARGQIVTPIPPRLPWNDPTVNGPRPRTIAGPHYFDHYPSILRCEEDLLALGHGRTGRAFPLMPMELDQIDHGGAEFTALNQIFATAANPINLSIYAVGETQRPGAHWRVIDDDPPNPRRVFHILLAPTAATPNRIEVYETGSALDMVVDQYQLFKNNAAYRGNIINGLHGEVNGLYPRGDVGAIFNAF